MQESVQARLSKRPNPSLFSCNFSPITSQGLGMVVEDRVWPTIVSMVCVISILRAGHAGLRKPGAHLAAKSESNQSGSSSLDQVVIARIRQPRCDDPWELKCEILWNSMKIIENPWNMLNLSIIFYTFPRHRDLWSIDQRRTSSNIALWAQDLGQVLWKTGSHCSDWLNKIRWT